MIGFFELPEEDQPPQRIWLDAERLEEWFDAVRSRRRSAAKGLEPLELDDEPGEQNELTKELIR